MEGREEEVPIEDRDTYPGVEISKNRSWDTHINKIIAKDEAQMSRMDVILRDSHLSTRIQIFILNVIVSKLQYP